MKKPQTDEDINRIIFFAKRYCRRKGIPCEAEDFAQDVALQAWLGRKASVEQMWTDNVRQRFGRFVDGQNRYMKLKSHVREIPIEQRWHDPRNKLNGDIDFKNIMQLLNEKDQKLFTMYFIEDRTLAEIGEYFGVTESRICQLVHMRCKKIKEVLRGKEQTKILLERLGYCSKRWGRR